MMEVITSENSRNLTTMFGIYGVDIIVSQRVGCWFQYLSLHKICIYLLAVVKKLLNGRFPNFFSCLTHISPDDGNKICRNVSPQFYHSYLRHIPKRQETHQLENQLLLVQLPQLVPGSPLPPDGGGTPWTAAIALGIPGPGEECRLSVHRADDRLQKTNALELVCRYLPHRGGGSRAAPGLVVRRG